MSLAEELRLHKEKMKLLEEQIRRMEPEKLQRPPSGLFLLLVFKFLIFLFLKDLIFKLFLTVEIFELILMYL